MHYCPGCTHGVVHKLIAEVIEELNIRIRPSVFPPVGCKRIKLTIISISTGLEAAHGRAPAVATAISRLHPENMYFPSGETVTWHLSDVAEITRSCNREKIS